MNSIGFVVATRDRPDDLRRMMESLAAQTYRPNLVVVVDSSAHPVGYVIKEFRDRLRVDYFHHLPPSAAAQRNAGIEATPRDIQLVAFLDDDAVLEPQAVETMLTFWMKAPSDLGGAAFNMVNHPAQAMRRIKRWPLISALGVYCREPGRVTRSGWQTMIGFVSQDTEVDWLPSGAVVWRSQLLQTCRFDEFYDGYSYLEDLDFSYTARRLWRLAVVADARYHHYPSTVRHTQQYSFGKTEVRNRLHFVARHRLSYPKCWMGLLLRMGMTLCSSVAHRERGALSRFVGNSMGMAAELSRFFATLQGPSKGQVSEIKNG